MQSPADPRIAAALERNDRYIREFIEALTLCPYARRTRESGMLHRVVVLEAGGAPQTPGFEAAVAALATAIAGVEALPADSVDVALLILPVLAPELSKGIEGARAFEHLVALARERMQARHPRGDSPFYCVPFHPDFAEDLRDEHRAVRFIRRSPDPTVQLVRASVLRAVRGGGATDYVNTTGLSATELMALTAPESVSDRIGRANLRTLENQGAPTLRRLLAEIRASYRRP